MVFISIGRLVGWRIEGSTFDYVSTIEGDRGVFSVAIAIIQTQVNPGRFPGSENRTSLHIVTLLN
jgi:hypothetical protein